MFSQTRKSLTARIALRRGGFTLVEIMIVVLIIGILLAIAIPNFVRAREQSRAKACSENLKQIQSALQQYAMDNKVAASGTAPALTVLYGPTAYIKSTPACPSNGSYSLGTGGTIDSDPVCDSSTTAYPHSVSGN